MEERIGFFGTNFLRIVFREELSLNLMPMRMPRQQNREMDLTSQVPRKTISPTIAIIPVSHLSVNPTKQDEPNLIPRF